MSTPAMTMPGADPAMTMPAADPAVYARLRATDPARWLGTALAWRRWAVLAGALRCEFGPLVTRLRAMWSGAAADAAAARIGGFGRRMALFRLFCWRADQALSEFAAALTRARALLDRARGDAARSGLVIDDRGAVHGRPDAAGPVAADLAAALSVAARADEAAAIRLGGLTGDATPPPAGSGRPSCTAGPAEVRRWWDGLTAAERNWVLATEPGSIASTDGIPASDRDLANRLLLEQQRGDLDRQLGEGDRARLRGLRDGLDELGARLEDDAGPRAYLMRLDVGGDGRAVVALGDPDRARHVLTHVPGMTSDLGSFGGELTRAERVAVRAAELGPAESTSAVLWLGYDAPDFVHEAFSDRQARDGALELRRFQEGLVATHDGPPADRTVLGHSYGSLVVGRAATGGPLETDRVVFVGSPGVGVDSAADLTVPAERVWSSTSRTDVIRLAAVPPGPELWFGRDPSTPGFGGQTFGSQPDAGHLGYWDRGRPALDAMATLTLGGTP
ncbi:alpha/beta hydrolase [Actinoplanes sp. GCM10030250]|uniref:alpha/beta hydrolase n=1 Tax=Actinoplanes sp. GCM10030250 TaxID=3273376 RepID=UPI00361CE988